MKVDLSTIRAVDMSTDGERPPEGGKTSGGLSFGLGRQDSNLQPAALETAALPVELHPSGDRRRQHVTGQFGHAG